MAISFITGKPGAGKGLVLISKIVEELRSSSRPVITNFAVEKLPWVSAQGVPQRGLISYCRHVLKSEELVGAVESRLFRVSDDDIEAFFLFRVVGGKLVKCEAFYDGKGNLQSFDTGPYASSGGVFYVVDEGWKFWGSRNWMKTGEGVLFYNAQHRKAGDDVLIATQHTKQIDSAIQRVAQDFWLVRNLSLVRMGPFRVGDNFKVEVYESPPTGGVQQKPMNSYKFKLDVAGLAQCYDTTAGVGLSGRMVGDVGRRKKGIPLKYLILACCAIPLLAFFGLPKLLAFGFARGKAALGLDVPKAVSPVPPVPGDTNRSLLQQKALSVFGIDKLSRSGGDTGLPGREAAREWVPMPEPVHMTGYAQLGGVWHVFLSNGEHHTSREAWFRGVGPSGCQIGTNLYPVVSQLGLGVGGPGQPKAFSMPTRSIR